MALAGAGGTGQSKTDFYRSICDQITELTANEGNMVANMANVSALLFHAMPEVNWLGFYLADGEELVLGPFQGKPACTRIAFGKGVCGRAAAQGETVLVPDVSQFPGHIVCDPESRSEVVVPLVNWGRLIGVLDVDSATLNRFDEDDQEGLEAAAAVFTASISTDDLPDLSDSAALD